MPDKLRVCCVKILDTQHGAAVRWLGNYNAAHSHDSGFAMLNFSDLVRLAVQSFISSVDARKFFYPKGE